jgi:hypothetical protein
LSVVTTRIEELQMRRKTAKAEGNGALLKALAEELDSAVANRDYLFFRIGLAVGAGAGESPALPAENPFAPRFTS